MRLPTLLFLFVLILVVVEFSDARARGGRGGGGRGGGGRSGGSRGRSGSRSRSSGSKSKPSITKNTPIKASTVRSPVIKLQTKLGSRSGIFKKTVAVYIVLRYSVLSTAPVYRQGYPMYGSYVSIPKNRSVRISYEEEKMLDKDGNLCLGRSSKEVKLQDGIDNQLLDVNTTVTYKKSGETFTFQGINETVVLEDKLEEDVVVTSGARFNTTLVEDTNCTQVFKRVEGTIVRLYETNPNGASVVAAVNVTLLGSLLIAFGLTGVFIA